MIYQTIINSFDSARKTRASWRHLLLQNDVWHGVRWRNIVLRWKDVTYTRKYMRHNPTIGWISSVQWRKVGRGWRLQMYFCRSLCVKIKIDQLYFVNYWIIIYCLSVNCTKINHLCYASWFDLLYNWPPNSELFRTDLFLHYSKLL